MECCHACAADFLGRYGLHLLLHKSSKSKEDKYWGKETETWEKRNFYCQSFLIEKGIKIIYLLPLADRMSTLFSGKQPIERFSLFILKSLNKNLLDLPVKLLKCDKTWLPDYHYLCGTYFPKGQYKFTVELVTAYYVGSPEARGRLGTSVTKWLIFGH